MGWAPLIALEISWLFELLLKEGQGKGVPGTCKLHMYKNGSGFLEKQGREGIAAWKDGKDRAELVREPKRWHWMLPLAKEGWTSQQQLPLASQAQAGSSPLLQPGSDLSFMFWLHFQLEPGNAEGRQVAWHQLSAWHLGCLSSLNFFHCLQLLSV